PSSGWAGRRGLSRRWAKAADFGLSWMERTKREAHLYIAGRRYGGRRDAHGIRFPGSPHRGDVAVGAARTGRHKLPFRKRPIRRSRTIPGTTSDTSRLENARH